MPKKYKIGNEETKQQFVARIVETENAPLTANAVIALIDKRSMKDVKASKIHANLSDAAKHGLIGKTRFQAEGDSRAYVHYHPVDMVVPGEDIPIPAFEKQGGYTKTPAETKEAVDSFNEQFKKAEEHSEETAELNHAFFEEARLWRKRNKPDAVKVAEKVLDDLGASDDEPAKREPLAMRVDIGTGWVDMENGVPKKFTPNAWTSIADCINATPEELTAMFVRHLSSRTIDHDHEVAGLCFRIKEMLLNDYGLSAHRRK